MAGPSRLYLVRHGQTDLNRDRRFRGMSEAALNADGRLEAQGAARLLAGSGVEAVHTSPVERSRETAEITAGRIGARVQVNEGIIDIDYGDWQGLTVEEVTARFGPAMIRSWRDDPGGFSFPGGESMESVRERLGPCLLELVADPGGAVAAVTHMAVLKVCFLVTMGLGWGWFWKIGIDSGSVSLFTYTPREGYVMQYWNRLPEPAD
jgi:probable phosphoglycerate mutase